VCVCTSMCVCMHIAAYCRMDRWPVQTNRGVCARVCVCVTEREREKETVCVCVLQRERERETVRMCACVCMYLCIQQLIVESTDGL